MRVFFYLLTLFTGEIGEPIQTILGGVFSLVPNASEVKTPRGRGGFPLEKTDLGRLNGCVNEAKLFHT